MKYASLKVIALVFATGSLIAACANGSDSPDFGSGGASATTSTSDTTGGGGTIPTTTATTTSGASGTGGTGGSTPTDGGAACLPKCNTDSDCQNSCPATQTGANCCDTQTNLCYVASTSICPVPDDGGVVMPPY